MRALAPLLGSLLGEYAQSTVPPCDVVVPVPLHPRRERSRGYNQALLLAQGVGRALEAPLAPTALRRVRDTPAQARTMGQGERRANVRDAFQTRSHPVEGRRVLLVDDVCTTSATLDACARALAATGAQRVWGLTLAREP